ncbi:MAG TPA: hypothetical protein VMW72_22970 [Sedimentisphaerales bacterium]|nr:hypothetical protein [Sedimentisphaerales bacterium]
MDFFEIFLKFFAFLPKNVQKGHVAASLRQAQAGGAATRRNTQVPKVTLTCHREAKPKSLP